jgi:hypothetical protein
MTLTALENDVLFIIFDILLKFEAEKIVLASGGYENITKDILRNSGVIVSIGCGIGRTCKSLHLIVQKYKKYLEEGPPQFHKNFPFYIGSNDKFIKNEISNWSDKKNVIKQNFNIEKIIIPKASGAFSLLYQKVEYKNNNINAAIIKFNLLKTIFKEQRTEFHIRNLKGGRFSLDFHLYVYPKKYSSLSIVTSREFHISHGQTCNYEEKENGKMIVKKGFEHCNIDEFRTFSQVQLEKKGLNKYKIFIDKILNDVSSEMKYYDFIKDKIDKFLEKRMIK